jgi:predicted transcriptional regulator
METTQSATTTVRLPRALVERIRVIAEAHDRSLSAELRVALDAYARRSMPEAERILKERTDEQDDQP